MLCPGTAVQGQKRGRAGASTGGGPCPGGGCFTPRCGASRLYQPRTVPNPIPKKFLRAGSGYSQEMFKNASRAQVQELVDRGAQLVEVLERRQFELAHLPGAVHIPAWELTPARAAALDRTRPVVVYCFDTL